MGPSKANKQLTLPKTESLDHDYLKAEMYNEIQFLNKDGLNKGVEKLQRKYGNDIATDIIRTLGIGVQQLDEEREQNQGETIFGETKEAKKVDFIKSKGTSSLFTKSTITTTNRDVEPMISPAILQPENVMQMFINFLNTGMEISNTFCKNTLNNTMNLSESLESYNTVAQDYSMGKIDRTLSSAVNSKSEFVMRSSSHTVESPTSSVSTVTHTNPVTAIDSFLQSVTCDSGFNNQSGAGVVVTTSTEVAWGGVSSSCSFTAGQISDLNMIMHTSADTIVFSEEMLESSSSPSNSVITNSVLTSPIMSTSTFPTNAHNLMTCVPISTAGDIQQNDDNQSFVSSRNVSSSHPFQPSVPPSPSTKITTVADHPLLIRSPVTYENTAINCSQQASKPLLVCTKPVDIVSSDDLITECISSEKSTFVHDNGVEKADNLMKFIQTDVDLPIAGGSLYAFCEEINDPEKKNIDFLENSYESCSTGNIADIHQPLMMEKKNTVPMEVSTLQEDIEPGRYMFSIFFIAFLKIKF